MGLMAGRAGKENAESLRYVKNFCLDMVAAGGDGEVSGVEAVISSNLWAEDLVDGRGGAILISM